MTELEDRKRAFVDYLDKAIASYFSNGEVFEEAIKFTVLDDWHARKVFPSFRRHVLDDGVAVFIPITNFYPRSPTTGTGTGTGSFACPHCGNAIKFGK